MKPIGYLIDVLMTLGCLGIVASLTVGVFTLEYVEFKIASGVIAASLAAVLVRIWFAKLQSERV